jgi:excisionase family DNA binding protein
MRTENVGEVSAESEVRRLLYRPREAFVVAGVSRSMGYALIASGEWQSIRIGKAIRIPVEALQQWIDNKIADSQGRVDE